MSDLFSYVKCRVYVSSALLFCYSMNMLSTKEYNPFSTFGCYLLLLSCITWADVLSLPDLGSAMDSP